MRLFIFVVCLAITSVVGAQPSEQFWTPAAEANHYQLSSGQLELILNQAPPEAEHQQPGVTTPRLQLPGPDGGLVTFKFWESPVMAAGLAANFPGIRTFIGQRVDAPSVTLRLDYTYEGLHAMVMDEAGDWFIDPVAENDNLYQVRRKPARAPGDFVCEVEGQPIDPDSPVGTAGTDKSLLSPIGGNLQTYRIAVAATGEFSQYHGGTVEGALSAIATIMHRINGVYERDLACRMILVDSNHLVIFLDASEDPYTGDSGTRMNTNHEVLTDSIGLDNFDIGHVFDRGGGGIASLGSVCRSSRKGRGYTSTDPPTGDLFAIDYAAHELGHQYGANHTFNNCGGSGPQPYEPGSATTIMGYAGLCGSNNVALNSDDHFHNASLVEMSNYVILGFGSSCAQLIDNGNNGPTIDEMPPSGLTIPISTPFELTGVASDLDDDELTYCWEQFDTGDVSPLGSPTGNAPLFRSRSPTTSPTRVFPRMGAVLQGLEEPSEVLPFYQRGMTFRLTVRDNNPAGGGVEWAEMDVDVSAQAGPFEVTSQSTFTTWTAGTFQVITWDVAGTNQAPVNADSVNIYLSEPGGMTYPYLLAGPVPNDGEATILLPSGVAGNGFRIKVKGHGNIFFDLNDANISIVNPSAPGVAFAAFEDELTVCAPDTAFFPLGLSGLQDFADTVYLSLANLPAGLEATLSTNQLVPPAFLDLTCANTQAVSTGNYEIQVIAEAADTIHDTLTLLLNIISDPPAAPVLSSPALDEVEIATTPLLQWYPVPGASGYEVEVAADPDFNDVLFFGTTVDTFL
ncbi:MAG: propanediol utilization protein, partial [Lewinella sp.]|nr:propanediol utilization protein [Lewinella sp.]